jgi:hypothetical protein
MLGKGDIEPPTAITDVAPSGSTTYSMWSLPLASNTVTQPLALATAVTMGPSNSSSLPASTPTAPPASQSLASSCIPDYQVRAHYSRPGHVSERHDTAAPVRQQCVKSNDSAPPSHYSHWPREICAGDRQSESNEVKWEKKARDSIALACTCTLPYRGRRIPLWCTKEAADRSMRYINAALDALPHCSLVTNEEIKATMDDLLLVIANLIDDSVSAEQLLRTSSSQPQSAQPPATALSFSSYRIKHLLGQISDDNLTSIDLGNNVTPEIICQLRYTKLDVVQRVIKECTELTTKYASLNGADLCLVARTQIQCMKANLWRVQLMARCEEAPTHRECSVPNTELHLATTSPTEDKHVDDNISDSDCDYGSEAQNSETGKSLKRSGHPLGLVVRPGESFLPDAPTDYQPVSPFDLSGTTESNPSPEVQKTNLDNTEQGQQADTDRDLSTATATKQAALDGFIDAGVLSWPAECNDPAPFREPLRLQLQLPFRVLNPFVWAGNFPDQVQSRVKHRHYVKLPCAGVNSTLPRSSQRRSLCQSRSDISFRPLTVSEHNYAQVQLRCSIFGDQGLIRPTSLKLEGRDLMPDVLILLQDSGTPTRWTWKPGITANMKLRSSFKIRYAESASAASGIIVRGLQHLCPIHGANDLPSMSFKLVDFDG